jgi:hypothetical protein
VLGLLVEINGLRNAFFSFEARRETWAIEIRELSKRICALSRALQRLPLLVQQRKTPGPGHFHAAALSGLIHFQIT